MRTILYILTATMMLAIAACGNKNSAPDADAKNTTQPLNRDSIRQVYESLMQNRANALPPTQVIETGRLRPVDEGPGDTIFFVFREEILKAIAQHDEFRLLQMVDDNVQTGFDGQSGVAAFVETWKLHTQKDSSELWQLLTNILNMGGAFSTDRQTFTAPYYAATFPDAYDANIFGVITGEGVRVRAQPHLNSQILKTISYEVLPVLNWSGESATIDGETHPWVKVKLNDSKEGYVFGKFIASPLGYRATFTRQTNGSWLMTALAKGD